MRRVFISTRNFFPSTLNPGGWLSLGHRPAHAVSLRSLTVGTRSSPGKVSSRTRRQRSHHSTHLERTSLSEAISKTIRLTQIASFAATGKGQQRKASFVATFMDDLFYLSMIFPQNSMAASEHRFVFSALPSTCFS